MAPAKKAAKKSTKKSTKKTAKKAPAKKTAKKAAAKKTAKKTSKKAAKKSGRKATSRSASSSAENVLVTSKLRDAIRGQDVRMAGDFPEALNAEVHDVIARAIKRAKDNNRGTVRPSDL